MADVWKLFAYSKVASVPYVFQLETQTISDQHFSDFFTYLRYPQQLEN